MMVLAQLTIYYLICVTMVYGNITPSIKQLIPSRSVKNDAPLKQLYTATRSDPNKSNLERFTDMSAPIDTVNTVVGDDDNTLNGVNEIVTDNENQRQATEAYEKPWRAFLHRNKIHVGNRAKQSLSPSARFMNHNSVRSIDTVQPSSKANQQQKLSRRKRGFRSAVADRIAHGFGKRTPLLSLGDDSLTNGVPNTLSKSDIDSIRDAIGQPAFQMTKQFLSLQPVSFEDVDTATNEILRKLLTLHQSRYIPAVRGSDGDNTLTSIYQKLVS